MHVRVVCMFPVSVAPPMEPPRECSGLGFWRMYHDAQDADDEPTVLAMSIPLTAEGIMRPYHTHVPRILENAQLRGSVFLII